MSKIVFCNIVGMKYYRGITEDDPPIKSGKYNKIADKAYECYNFLPVNHFCYGYFQHIGEQLDLKRIEKAGKNADVLHQLTVVWVANRKIVGLYDDADIFRYWQTFSEPLFDENHVDWDHWVKAREENVYLIPVEERNFVVPSASRAGRGRGMGQSNIWYADTEWAQEIFLPQVEEYLETVREKYPNPYLTIRKVNKKIQSSDLSESELFEKADELLDSNELLQALEIYNYLVFNATVPYESCMARYKRGIALEKLLMYDEAVGSYKRTLYEFDQLDDESKEKIGDLNLECYKKLARLYFIMKEYSVAYSLWKKTFYADKDVSKKTYALYNMMRVCKAANAWESLQELLETYENLHTNEYADEVERFRKTLNAELAKF